MKIEFITLSESGKQTKLWEPAYQIPLLWPILASLTPSDVPIKVQDEHFRSISTHGDSDIVGITVSTSVAARAYELGRKFKRQGKMVVYGGPHITTISQYLQFKDEPFVHGRADAVFRGDSELSWPRFIEDLSLGRIRKVYNGGLFRFNSKINPRRDIITPRGLSTYLPPIWNVETSRGCRGACSFCTSSGEYRTKPLDDLVSELDSIPVRHVQFADSNFGADKKRLKGILEYLGGRDIRWAANFYLPTLDKETIERLAKAGCIYVYVGFESVNPESLSDANKKFNKVDEYEGIIKQLHDNNIRVIGSFIFGFDHEDKSIFERTLHEIQKLQLDDASFHILIPYPGTQIFDNLKQEGRLFYTNFPEDWGHYNRGEISFLPKNMKPEELEEGYRLVCREFYSMGSAYNRLVAGRSFAANDALFLMVNILKCLRTR